MNRRRWPTGLPRASNLALAALSFLAGSIVMDRGLGLLGFPEDWLGKVSNPPDYHEQRRNIEFGYDFRTNSRGLRERELSLAKAPGLVRLWVAGDSFTEGVGVTGPETFVRRLETDLRSRGQAVEAINGGLNGAGPREYGRLFLEVGTAYHPDGLVLCIYANDVSDTSPQAAEGELDGRTAPRRGMRAALHRVWPHVYALLLQLHYERLERANTRPPDLVEAVSRRAREQGVPPERIEQWKARLPPELVAAANEGRFNGYLLSHGLLRPQWWRDALDLDTPEAEARFRAMCGLLSSVVRRSRARGIAAAAVFAPSQLQYDASLYQPEAENLYRRVGVEVRPEWASETTALQRRLGLWAEKEGLPFLDLTPAFRQAVGRAPLTWRLDEHWTSEGHRVAACAIAAWLETGPIFPFVAAAPGGPAGAECAPGHGSLARILEGP